ncbi:hypothetical protein V7S43_001339 [Phytophthora oleae]|uniref:RXLR effector n=1 Tax=Phytophthora oleae TaxID=2107226 RepID=A0ABD3G6K1_9STRA
MDKSKGARRRLQGVPPNDKSIPQVLCSTSRDTKRLGGSVEKIMSSMLPGDKNNELWKKKIQKKNVV